MGESECVPGLVSMYRPASTAGLVLGWSGAYSQPIHLSLSTQPTFPSPGWAPRAPCKPE